MLCRAEPHCPSNHWVQGSPSSLQLATGRLPSGDAIHENFAGFTAEPLANFAPAGADSVLATHWDNVQRRFIRPSVADVCLFGAASPYNPASQTQRGKAKPERSRFRRDRCV